MIMLAKTTFGTLKQFLDDIRLQGGPQSSYGKVCVPYTYMCVSKCLWVLNFVGFNFGGFYCRRHTNKLLFLKQCSLICRNSTVNM